MVDTVEAEAQQSPKIGLLTKTIVPSPVITRILPARVRHRRLNDIIFVGEDFIQVSEVKNGGHIEAITSKHDFGSRICSANVFSIEDLTAYHQDDLLQYQAEYDDLPKPVIPAQLLVLVLEAQDVIFLYVTKQDDGDFVFRHQQIPLIKWPDRLLQVGEHLTIDPYSRAMAIASRGGQVILYSAKDKDAFRQELLDNLENWCPVTQEQVINGGGSIQHISFLYPQRTDVDHVILLVVVVDPPVRKTRLKWFDWRVSRGIRKLQTHDPIPIDAPKCVPTLLIPLCNTNFMLVYDKTFHFHKNLLSGTPTKHSIPGIDNDVPPAYPGNSPMFPLWINWCRPMRSPGAVQNRDSLYVVREDGKVFLLIVHRDGDIQSSIAGDLNCHVGQAFASLGDDMNPDMLAVAADMSTGRVVSIGNWYTPRLNSRNREETMDMKLVELLPNWASVTDMAVTRVSSSGSRASKTRDSVFLSSGRQPYGTVTEIRKGLEASLMTYLELPGLANMLNVWALPDPPTGSVVLLLSTPESTDVYKLTGGPEGIEIMTTQSIFETSHASLAADITKSNLLVQVTGRTLTVAGSLDAGFEDKVSIEVDAVCAAIEPTQDLIFCCEQVENEHVLNSYKCQSGPESDELIKDGPRVTLPVLPLCMTSMAYKGSAVVLVSDQTGTISVFLCDDAQILRLGDFTLSADDEPCDQMIMLLAEDKLIVVGSLRNGTLVLRTLSIDPFSVSPPRNMPFGNSTVKLVRLSSELDRAYAICGTDTCLLRTEPKLSIESIWTTDKNRPHLWQRNIFGCARLPHPDRLSTDGGLHTLGNALVMLSAEELWITALGSKTGVVPRQLRVSGSPFRIVYAHALRTLICASMVTELTETGDRRRCMPCVEAVPAKGAQTVAYIMEPGDEVYSMLEWSPKSIEKDKSYSFVLVGGKYIKPGTEAETRGKILFLRLPKDGNLQLQHHLRLPEPVYSMALYDDLTFVVCYGSFVALYRFSFEDARVRSISQPVRMASIGASITCAAPLIYVTTRQDSMIVFRVEEMHNNDTDDSYHLVVDSTGPRGDVGVAHVVLSLEGVSTEQNMDLAIMTTSERQVIGLALPRENPDISHARSSSIAFETFLPQSISRIRKCSVRAPWTLTRSPHVLEDEIVGCCTDGSLVGLAVLDEHLWRRLFWLQRLCEWNDTISPHSAGKPIYTVTNDDGRGIDRALPIGLTKQANIVLAAPDAATDRSRDMHIDGNVLVRLLDRGGANLLRSMIEQTAKRQDRVGEWVKQHLDEEIMAIDGCIEELKGLLISWM